jgi:phospholipid/cholesterol/gamma-HCH transport system substrate-binding protein
MSTPQLPPTPATETPTTSAPPPPVSAAVGLRWRNLRTGLLVFFGLALVALLALIIGRNTSILTKKVTYKLFVTDIKGLAENNMVAVAGKKVGAVTTLTFTTRNDTIGIDIDLSINEQFTHLFTATSRATIKGQGILGDKYIEVTPGKGETLAAGTFIPVDEEGGLDELTKSLSQVVNKINRGEGTLGKLIASDELNTKLVKTVSNLETMTNKMSNGNGLMAKLINDGGLSTKVSSMVSNLNDVSESLKSGRGSLGKLLVDDAFYNNLNAVSMRTDSLIAKLNNPNSSLGKFSNDPQLYNNLNRSVQSLDSLLVDLKQNPGRYVKLSLF